MWWIIGVGFVVMVYLFFLSLGLTAKNGDRKAGYDENKQYESRLK